jgi:hypothetical protein
MCQDNILRANENTAEGAQSFPQFRLSTKASSEIYDFFRQWTWSECGVTEYTNNFGPKMLNI